MSNINGIDNEYKFVKYLNGKRVKELNPLFRELIEELFHPKEEDATIKRLIYKNKWCNEGNKYQKRNEKFISCRKNIRLH